MRGRRISRLPRGIFEIVVLVLVAWASRERCAWADGKIVPPRDYKGSLEERGQEAILIFDRPGEGKAIQDLILKVTIEGNAREFAWVIPFPNPPETFREDPALFSELFRYAETRATRSRSHKSGDAKSAAADKAKGVEVISRKVVGNFDVAITREDQPGALARWLDDEGYQSIEDSDDIIGWYRKKGYVFACVKVSEFALADEKQADSHPLRFRFHAGEKDGIYFPMKMTGLQSAPFDVNLYVFYPAWINDKLNRFGFIHRGFRLQYRDWDSPDCEPNAGKTWSSPSTDPFLAPYASFLPTVEKLFAKLYPGDRFYLTNLQAHGLAPVQVRHWSDDLWLFPYYTDTSFVPFDARPGGPAREAWTNVKVNESGQDPAAVQAAIAVERPQSFAWIIGGVAFVVAVIGTAIVLSKRQTAPCKAADHPAA